MAAKSQLNDLQGILSEIQARFPIAKEEYVRSHLKEETEAEQGRIRRWLRRNSPFTENETELRVAEEELAANKEVQIGQLEQDLRLFESLAKQTQSRIDSTYWSSEINKIKEARAKFKASKNESDPHQEINEGDEDESEGPQEQATILRTLLLRNWRRLSDEQTARWELENIRKFRQELLARLRAWLEKLQLLADTLNELSIEPGLLFDLSKDNLSLSDIEQLKKWVAYISEDDGVRQLCDLMGRLRRAEKTKRQELVRTRTTITEYVPDINSREEIVGLVWGNDIERVVPQELTLLSDEETSVLFDVKLAEGRLMCFEMEGVQSRSREDEEERLTEVEDEEKLGPVIICVDTSGSMQGSPEIIAKAVTLFMATRAVSQKRNCFLINFSTDIETLDLSGKTGVAKVIEFLQRSFHGGTDVNPALTHALKIMEDRKYNRSDLLVISDFLMASVPESLQDMIRLAKEKGNRFYSLSIGDLYLSKRLEALFDNEWVYNPRDSSIRSIQAITSAMERQSTG